MAPGVRAARLPDGPNGYAAGVTSDDSEATEQLRTEQARRARAERAAAERAEQADDAQEAHTHDRRAEQAAYLAGRLAARERTRAGAGAPRARLDPPDGTKRRRARTRSFRRARPSGRMS